MINVTVTIKQRDCLFVFHQQIRFVITIFYAKETNQKWNN